jgi:hypothetical protein
VSASYSLCGSDINAQVAVLLNEPGIEHGSSIVCGGRDAPLSAPLSKENSSQVNRD